VFLKGCPLSCIWCHNPESRHKAPQKILKELKLDNSVHVSEELIGKEMTVSEVMQVIKKDFIFYEESGGGVTFSGGEVFLQENFLISLLAECKKNDIHTCIDTTGYTKKESLDAAMPLTDLFLYDIKLMDDAEHTEYCGVSNRAILDNFRYLKEAGKDVRVRFPVIPGITDTEKNIESLAEFLSGFDDIKIDLLPYHRIGSDKYRRLGMEYHMKDVAQPDKTHMEKIRKFFSSKGFDTGIGG
jgi:pyruvate formate lyase activating enzyme